MVKTLQKITNEVKRIQLLTYPKRAKYSATSWVQVNLYADGIPLVDYNRYNINLKELVRSLQGTGVFRIICCGCGDDNCDANGELIVYVTHHVNYIEWHNGENLPFGHYYFTKEQYYNTVLQLDKELFIIKKSKPLKLDSGGQGTANGRRTLPNNLLEDKEQP